MLSRGVRLVALEAIPVLLDEIKKEGERLLKAIDKAEKAAGETLMGRPEKIHVVRSRSDKPKSKTIHVCVMPVEVKTRTIRTEVGPVQVETRTVRLMYGPFDEQDFILGP